MIDAHHHLWDYNTKDFGWISEDMAVIRKSFGVSELSDTLTPAGITGAVAVQARTALEENDFLLAAAEQSELIKAVVGWVDLKSDTLENQLDHYTPNPVFKGVREITQGAPDEQFFDHPDFHRGMRELTKRDLSYDVLIFQDQIAAATRFIDQHPEQRFVLDHAAKPEIRADEFPTAWEQGLREMAKRPHLCCKVSGLVTEVRDPSFSHDIFDRYLDILLEAFGPERLMFGSDWPVCLLGSSYADWKNTVTSHLDALSDSEQRDIFSGTASQFYHI